MDRRKVLCILILTTLYFMSLSLIATVIARYSRDLGVSIETTGLLWSILFITALILRPLVGYLADRFGAFKILLLGVLTLSASSLLYAMGTFLYLVFGRVVQGVSTAFFISPSIATTAILAGNQAGMVLGLRSALISLSRVIAPPIAGFIYDTLGGKVVFITSFIASLPLILILTILSGKDMRNVKVDGSGSDNAGNVKWGSVISRELILMVFVGVMMGSSFMTLTSLVQMHYRDLGYAAKVFGAFYMALSLIGLITRLISGKLISKYRPELVSLTGFIFQGIGALLLALFYIEPYSYIAATIYGFGIGLIIPANQFKVISIAPKGGENRAIALLNMGFDGGAFIGPIVYSYVASVYGYVKSYILLTIPSLVAIVLLIIMYKSG